MPGADFIVEVLFKDPPKSLASPGAALRFGYVLLQSLLAIVLSYQLLFSEEKVLPPEAEQLLVVGLLLLIPILMNVPARVLESDWFVILLVLGDTALTTAIIYLSGNNSSELYITYFLVILIAAFSTSLKQLIGLSLILCVAYGLLLTLGLKESGSLSESHLLRIPMLFIMATFYGVFAEKVRRERHSKVELIDYVAALKQAEKERESLIQQLQDALTKVKVLQGILPICARCKKIRDGKGDWHAMESYIREHSDADFSHGVCPECLNKLYPGYSE